MVTRIGLRSARPIRTYFKEWREWKGWTQQEVADRLETTTATVSRIENGARDWSKGYVEAFAHVIGCDDPADPITRPPDGPDPIMKLLRSASPEKQAEALRIVEALLKAS
jgi:transcriptional regulator with XRE-family HTH domain